LILKPILITSDRPSNLQQAGPFHAVQVKTHGFQEPYLGDPVRMQTFGQIAHIVDDLVQHLTAGLNAFVGRMLFLEREDGQGQLDNRKHLSDIIVELLGDRLEGRFLDLQLRPQQFLLVFVLYARQLLFLPVLSALVQEKHGNYEAYQQQGKRNSYQDYDIDLLVLSRHKKAIVNDKYKKIFNITKMVNKLAMITLGRPSTNLVRTYSGKVQA
jgi:hypothetical protein